MEWLQRLNEAVTYIEANLTGEISYDEAARIACCSTFHFQRMFSYIANVPLSEYIRRRRMTAAAFELQSGGSKVVDLALKYGYESPTAFNRAFQSVHGIPPTAARDEGVNLRAYPRIAFQIVIKGDVSMEYKIVKKEPFRIVGAKAALDSNWENSVKEVPKFWAQVGQSGLIPKLCPLMEGEPLGILGISTFIQGEDSFDYYIGVASNKPCIEGTQEFMVPASTWAVFPGEGTMPDAIQELQKRIVTEWLPASGYEYANAPDIEVYLNDDNRASKFEVWLPVVKK